MSSGLESQQGESNTAQSFGAAATLLYERMCQRERQRQTSRALPIQQSGSP
ncbi:MAG: hypothetical protein V7K30_14890 [Nostoc sp.]